MDKAAVVQHGLEGTGIEGTGYTDGRGLRITTARGIHGGSITHHIGDLQTAARAQHPEEFCQHRVFSHRKVDGATGDDNIGTAGLRGQFRHLRFMEFGPRKSARGGGFPDNVW